VGPLERIGRKTFFNIFGTNGKYHFKNQLVGVFNLELARMYAYLYQNTNTIFTILHSLDGYDERFVDRIYKTLPSSMEECKSEF
jgi:anthranilate phosphoribosyltransferase